MGGVVFETESERLIREGISQANADTITRMLKKGKTPQEIHDLLDYPMEEIEQVTRKLQTV
jgi:predicted transposase YdaD